MVSVHTRLDEMEHEYGWRRGMETGTGAIAVDKEAQSMLAGRTVKLLCYRDRDQKLVWSVGALWMLGPHNRSIVGADRRTRKYLKNNGDELVGLFLTSTMRSVLEGDWNETSGSPAEESLRIATGGVIYVGEGDPPPAQNVVAICDQLAEFATRVEGYLKASI